MEAMKNRVQGYLTLMCAYFIAIFKLWFSKEKKDLEKDMEHLTKSELQFYIPSQILAEIFYHLPQKSLARCKAVSKQWNSCINNYHFADEYIYRNPRISYLLRLDGRICVTSPSLRKLHLFAIGFDGLTNLRTMELPNCYDVMLPSMLGLVCLHGYYGTSIAVFNPTTAELIPLPDLQERLLVFLKDGNNRMRYNELGFGYDPQSKKYKLVQMVHDLTRNGIIRSCYVLTVARSRSSWRARDMLLCPKKIINMILTATWPRSSWRKIEMCFDSKELVIDSRGFTRCVDGKLYRVMSRLNDRDPRKILMFDLGCDKIELIPCPVISSVDHSRPGMHLVELQGRLGFSQWVSAGASIVMDISMLNYSRCCVTWDLIHRLELGAFPYRRCFPLCIMPDRILLMDRQTLYSYDLEEKSVTICGRFESDYSLSDWAAIHRTNVHAETLVFLS